MTQKVNPSQARPAEAFKTAGAIALAGGSETGWISPPSEPSDLSVQDTSIVESDLDAFSATTSASSFDVTIEGGEAFVYGSWVVKDSSTTVTLNASTSDQMVYVGWDKNGTNQVIVGLESSFETAADNTDEKIPIYSFDTDSTGVVSTTDFREIGNVANSDAFVGTDELDTEKSLRVDSNEQMVVGGSYTISGDATIDGDLVTVENSPSHQTLTDINPTDHLQVVKEYTVTASSGSQPAFDGTLSEVWDDQRTALDVTVAPANGIDDSYSFNYDDGRTWNNGSWDVPLTINWDDQPSSDLELTVRIHKRT